MLNIDELCKSLDKNHWTKEVQLVESYYTENNTSVRKLAAELNKTKSWVGECLKLAVGLRVFPALEKEPNKYSAMKFLKKREKQVEFLKKLKLI